MHQFTATIAFLRPNLAVVELATAAGAWAGSYRVDAHPSAPLYDLGYNRAATEAALKGGRLERYSRAKS